MQRKASPDIGRLECSYQAGQFYSTAFSFELLAGSTQLVMPPVLSIKRVIGNCGVHSMSRPPRLPVMLAARNPAKAPSSRWTPTPPLPVMVGLERPLGVGEHSYANVAVTTDRTAIE